MSQLSAVFPPHLSLFFSGYFGSTRVWIVQIKENDVSKQLVIMGFLGYFFYGYGIYVIERVYTILYLVYMAIFGLSFYSLIYSGINLRKDIFPKITQSKSIRKVSTAFLLITPLVFYPLWISQLVPLMQTGEKIEYLYSIYILDLCFLMSLFLIIAVLVKKNEGLGLLLAPAVLFLGFMILAPLALGEVLKPLLYNQSMDPAGIGLFFPLSLVYFILAVVSFRSLDIRE